MLMNVNEIDVILEARKKMGAFYILRAYLVVDRGLDIYTETK